jgi:DNA-binding CsgD family transcriptional regulator
VGRKREIAALKSELDQVRAGTARLMAIDGPAGIGKTALVDWFLGQAHGLHVIKVDGDENESALPYGLLGQIRLQADTMPEELACLLESDGTDVLAAGSAMAAFLGELQNYGPTVLVIDDAHWADAASLEALTFTFRRLRRDRAFVIVLTRDRDDPGLPEALSRVLARDTTVRISLDGLTSREVGELSECLGQMRLPPAAVRRLHAHTGGNPLHARALLEQVPAEALTDLEAPLPAPRSLALLLLGQVARCDDHARRLVEAASVLGMSSALHEATELAGLDEPLLPLERAVQAGLLRERHVGRLIISFPHPLVQAAIYGNLGPATRTRLHLRAADLFGDDYRRLHHRFRAANRPDPQLATELVTYGRDQAATGLWAGAAVHLSRAARLTTVAQERERWTGEAVLAALYAGQAGEASVLAQGLSGATDEALRAFCLGVVAHVAGRGVEASRYLEYAWQRCDPVADPALAGWIAVQLAGLSIMQGHARDAVTWAEKALTMPVPRAHGDLLEFLLFTGLADAGEIDQALALGAGLPDAPEEGITGLDPLLGRGAVRMWSDDLHGALHDLTRVAAASTRLSIPFRVTATGLLGETEYRMGHWDDAVVHTKQSASVCDDADQIWLASRAHAEAAFVPAARGEWEDAAAHVRAAHQALGSYPSVAAHICTATASAELATARDDPEGVVSALNPLLDMEGRGGVFEPGIMPWQALLADALIDLGQLKQAQQVLERCEMLATDRGRHSELAAAGRARGNLHAARREPDRADAAYRAGLEHAAQVDMPFTQARLRLAYGAFLRRSGRRGAAIKQLEAAQQALAWLGAQPYLERCDQELAASGYSMDSARYTVGHELTPQEQAVAKLVIKGLTNRQVARKLVLSVKTVEYHLSNVYAKFDVTSRTALATKLATPQTSGSPRVSATIR